MGNEQESTQTRHGARILPLEDAHRAATGGKARGLAHLISLGLQVPAGFVLTGAQPGQLPQELGRAYRQLGGGPVAVRSSADAEDGTTASFAGQFESVLGVEGETALRDAVERCLASVHSARARAYADQSGQPGKMSVVVQRMVEPRVAGVLFTVDPIAGRPDRLLVDAVQGLGEPLVAGRESSDHYELSRSGELLARELRGQRPLLAPAELRRLVTEALSAEAGLGVPLDLEWAIDGDGLLLWLQARPITGLRQQAAVAAAEEPDLHELDTDADAGHVYTRANVGEMLPGPVCPLTLSTAVHSVDQGIQRMRVICRVQPRLRPSLQLIKIFFGHLFFDLTALAEFSRAVGGSTPEQVAFAICGRPVPELEGGPPAPRLSRALAGVRFLRYVLGGARRLALFERRLQGFAIHANGGAKEIYTELDAKLPFLTETYDMHLQSSASSGLSHGVLQGVLAKGGPPLPEHEALMASWLQDAGLLESATMVDELEEVRRSIGEEPGAEEAFLRTDAARALAWLRSPQSGRAGSAFAAFLARQGHRGEGELSLQQPSWADDPLPLVHALRAGLGGDRRDRRETAPQRATASPPRPPLALRGLVGWARRGVRQRERSKALLVRVTGHFRQGYRRLGKQLAAEALLPEAGLVFFLTHQELGRLIETPDPQLASRAARRRLAQARQRALEFPDVFVGSPRPVAATSSPADGHLQGRPVSRGRVQGRARVACSLADAAALRPGEILVAPITDVGWSPYFKIIAGLATDVGSAISHGAVVARECGLPAVVNLRVASKVIRTGDLVVLDGDRGTLTRLEEGESR